MKSLGTGSAWDYDVTGVKEDRDEKIPPLLLKETIRLQIVFSFMSIAFTAKIMPNERNPRPWTAVDYHYGGDIVLQVSIHMKDEKDHPIMTHLWSSCTF
ncbi:Hypothetical predicted protein [Mytilus galloprovincialis]|uniref:Uncharacterized protein n=1 Tax=Mytilus galloprovincialis TaxID=29158 RepID=A0A8B6EW93_MYTGA|nr:Hypothetical predicted protein [Mytilus galloprovincialis]